jgi:hypothetical protein
MTASESDALLAEPLPTSALSLCPEPLFGRDVGQALYSPLQPGSYPERAGVLAHPSGRL